MNICGKIATFAKPRNVTGHPKKTTTLNNKEHIKTENASAQTAHLVLPDTQADPSQNQKSRFLPTHRTTLTE
jgi:hypothetical protein